MSYWGKQPTLNRTKYTPLSADPSNPTEGDVFYSDGTSRTEGLWFYKNAAWLRLAEGSAGALDVVTKTANFTLTTDNDVIIADATSGSFTLTLPTAVGNTGKVFYFHIITTNSNTVTIDGNSSETIDGALTQVINGTNTSISIVSENVGWKNLSENRGKVVYLKDVKATTVNGGTFSSGAWLRRTLNTIEGDSEIITSLTTSQWTLQAGTYTMEAITQAFNVGQHVCRIYNVTDASTVADGITAANGSSGAITTTTSALGTITIASAKVFELEHQCQVTSNTVGLGLATGFGGNEIYTQVKITKIK